MRVIASEEIIESIRENSGEVHLHRTPQKRLSNSHDVPSATRIWAVQIWLAVLLLFYCTLRELIRVVGHQQVLHMFFGHSGSHTS